MSIDADDDARQAADRGLSRRSMIKGAAIAGAAAWTAPVIIDSLSSPAAAGSVCNIYWVKIDASSTGRSTPCCYSAAPGNLGMFPVSDAKWAGASTCGCGNPSGTPSGTLAGGNPHMPAPVTGTSTYTVTLGSSCTFDSTKTGWTIGGRYTKSGNDYYQYGTATNNTATGTIPKQMQVSGDDKDLAYIYLKFCCTTA